MNTPGAQLCDNQHVCWRKITLMHKRQRILCRYVACRASKEFSPFTIMEAALCSAWPDTHAESPQEGKKKKSRRKPWGEGQRWCVGWRWIYLHISLPLRKTHPDTPRWEEGGGEHGRGRERGGDRVEEEQEVEGAVRTEWCTVPETQGGWRSQHSKIEKKRD